MQAETKKGLCHKCNFLIEIPLTECLTQCSNCKETILFMCHIIKTEIQPKIKVECGVCHSNFTIIMCPRCKGYSGIKNFMSGFAYECPCSYKSTLVICNSCLRLLSLPSSKNYEKTLITCKSCRNQFKYKICTHCKADIYKRGGDQSNIYKCPNPECPSAKENANQMHNPYSDPENVNKGLSQKVRESMVEEKELCKVCLDNEANMINVQCYHLSVCEGCAPSLKKQCPICRAKGQYKKVFKS